MAEDKVPLDIRGALAERKRIVAWLRSVNERLKKPNDAPCPEVEEGNRRSEIYYSHRNADEIEKGEHVDCPKKSY